MPPSIAWLPQPPDSFLGQALGERGQVWLPYVAESAEPQGAGVSIGGTFDAGALALGILLTARGRPPGVSGPPLTDAQLCWVLRQCARQLGHESIEVTVQRSAFRALQRHGRDATKYVLRRALELLPDCVLCLGDLMANLFIEACTEEREVGANLREVALLFDRWATLETRAHPDEAKVWYVGFAALTYIGKDAEREARVVEHGKVLARSQWLRDQLPRLRAAGPRWIGGIALEAGGGTWPPGVKKSNAWNGGLGVLLVAIVGVYLNIRSVNLAFTAPPSQLDSGTP